MEQFGGPIKGTKMYKKVRYPVECAAICKDRKRQGCILWAWNKKKLTCKVTLLFGKL